MKSEEGARNAAVEYGVSLNNIEEHCDGERGGRGEGRKRRTSSLFMAQTYLNMPYSMAWYSVVATMNLRSRHERAKKQRRQAWR